jgi:hypothetical protein
MFDVLHANRLHTFASHCRCSEAHNIVHVMAIRSLEKAKLGQTKSFQLAMGLSPFETAPVRYRVLATVFLNRDRQV